MIPIWFRLLTNNIAKSHEIGNLRAEIGSAEKLPYNDCEFDGAWLFGFVFLLDREKVLSEVARIVSPGGKVFLGALNGPGKIIQKLCLSFKKGGDKSADFIKYLEALKKGALCDGPPNFCTRKDLPEILGRFGLELDDRTEILTFQAFEPDEELRPYLENLGMFADKFENSSEFRMRILDNLNVVMRSLEFDIWCVARKVDGRSL